MIEQRLALLHEIDRRSKSIALEFINSGLITENVIRTIIELYSSAQVERVLIDEHFEAAYHAPVTGELEFLISRILFHFSDKNKLRWKIYLRRQESSVAPDIRISKEDKTISVIEIKAKGGWIQPFLSLERYNSDTKKFNDGHHFNPDDLIAKHRHQLNKYMITFGLTNKDVYYFLPTLALVHRKKYKSTLDDYFNYFSTTSQLPKENFILLSTNKRLDLGHKPNLTALEPTDHLERMIRELTTK